MSDDKQITELRNRIEQEQRSRAFNVKMLEKMTESTWRSDLEKQIERIDASIKQLENMIWKLEHPTPAGLWARITGKK